MILLTPATAVLAQLNTPLTTAQVRSLAPLCARRVHPDTIEAVIRQESAYHPYALSINRPQTDATRQGYHDSLYQLARQPRSLREAVAWTLWLESHGHTVSIGLMQVNTEVAATLGITDPTALFNPCLNIAAGAAILKNAYAGQPHTLQGLARAFAIYNSGSVALGIRNGYASGVIEKAPPINEPSPTYKKKEHNAY